MEKVNKFHLS